MFAPKPINKFALMTHLPLAKEEEEKMIKSINETGQINPIWTKNGEVVDGVHLQRFVIQCGKTPFYQEIPTELSAIEWRFLQNECRAHYTLPQKAKIALQYEKAFKEEAKENQRVAGKRFGRGKNISNGVQAPIANAGRAADKAAKMQGISRKTMCNYKKVVDSDCTPLIEAVDNEDITIKLGAELAKLDREQLTKVILNVGSKKLKSFYYNVKKLEREEREAEGLKNALAFSEEYSSHTNRYQLYCGDMSEILKQLKSDFADFIITDPPYVKEGIGLSEKLGEFGKKVLKKEGVFVGLYGQYSLNKVWSLLEKNLKFVWQCIYLMKHGSKALGGVGSRKFFVYFKNILVFTKQTYKRELMPDIIDAGYNRGEKIKYGFRWAQSTVGFQNIVNEFVKPGEIIIDPLMGVGTTGVCALKRGCYFIGIEMNKDRFKIASKTIV